MRWNHNDERGPEHVVPRTRTLDSTGMAERVARQPVDRGEDGSS